LNRRSFPKPEAPLSPNKEKKNIVHINADDIDYTQVEGEEGEGTRRIRY